MLQAGKHCSLLCWNLCRQVQAGQAARTTRRNSTNQNLEYNHSRSRCNIQKYKIKCVFTFIISILFFKSKISQRLFGHTFYRIFSQKNKKLPTRFCLFIWGPGIVFDKKKFLKSRDTVTLSLIKLNVNERITENYWFHSPA